MKTTLRDLFLDVLGALSIERALPELVRSQNGVLSIGGEHIELAPFKKILCVAIGKAAYPMARTLSRIVAPTVVSGIVVSPVPVPEPLPYFLSYEGGHPYPNGHSFHAADVAGELLSDMKPYYLVIHLLSGGGSAIFEKPIHPSITLDDCRSFYRTLVTCGAGIVEMNILRKHLSAVKGGRLAEIAHPARQVTVYLSDVPPDSPSSVASGPTMPDESTLDQCRTLVDRLNLGPLLPASVLRLIKEGPLPETPKPGAGIFEHSSWHCLLDNQAALVRLDKTARSRGWVTETDISVDDWPLDRAVPHLLGKLVELKKQHPGQTVALLTGGELSCPVRGEGRGGRNQAFVLECARRIEGERIAVLSAGTDGIDGNSIAAGAVADGETLSRARKLGLDAADFDRRSDSSTFFDALNDRVITGPTGNNVRDVRILAAY